MPQWFFGRNGKWICSSFYSLIPWFFMFLFYWGHSTIQNVFIQRLHWVLEDGGWNSIFIECCLWAVLHLCFLWAVLTLYWAGSFLVMLHMYDTISGSLGHGTIVALPLLCLCCILLIHLVGACYVKSYAVDQMWYLVIQNYLTILLPLTDGEQQIWF